MSSERIAKFLDKLPADLRPLAASMMDSVAAGLLDNAQATVDTLILGSPEDAYTTMLSSLPTPQVIGMLASVNERMADIADTAEANIAVQHMFFRELILLAFAFLRSEVAETI